MADDLKKMAAEKALSFVESDMIIGLGSGSTAAEFVKLLAASLQNGTLKNVVGVPTSEGTAKLAIDLGLTLKTLGQVDKLDVVVDGADEVDPDLNLIKGLGKALLREKMVEVHTDNFIVVVDESKLVQKLGTKGPLPIEVVKFGADSTVKWLNTLGCRAELWLEQDGTQAMTDNGNFLIKCWFKEGINDVYELENLLCKRPGIVEHGLFLDMAKKVIVAGANGISIQSK